MNNLDPAIWKNKTLGEAVSNKFLEEVEAQAVEDRVSSQEGRPAREVKRDVRHPVYIEAYGVDSNAAQPLTYSPVAESPDSSENSNQEEFGE